ncbi:MAG: D-alanyl-D-alanine carboxypeptidase/D-alanyl-D-alanine-endopeptidase [bacterium]|nr:D-alanyl-D-alanine carboxypeptidase/D-alanyl-D-alanine-endopeptidase [bacterium]
MLKKRKLFIYFLIIGIFASPLFLSCLPTNVYADFESDFNDIIVKNGLQKVNFGLEVMNIDSQTIIYSRNSEALFMPASNVKILTSLTALTVLGADYTFNTEIFYDDTNLFIKGYGNPDLKLSDIIELTDIIADYGIIAINDIVYDNSYFNEEECGKGWVNEPRASLVAPRVSAISLNKNHISILIKQGKLGKKISLYPKTNYFTVLDSTKADEMGLTINLKSTDDKNYIIIKGDSSASGEFTRNVDNPAAYMTTILKEMLEKKGITITGKVTRGIVKDSCKNICTHSSNPLLYLIYYMNKNSDNFYAEHILKAVGAKGGTPPGSFEKGTNEVYKLLKGIGLSKDEIRIFDGSGLSRYNLISPHGLVKVLASAISEWGIRNEFISSLPIAGVDGTLKHRLRTSECKGNVRAKTGTMLSVSSLAGYAYTQNKNLIIFSIMMDNYVLDTPKIKQAEDKIIELIIKNF